MTARTLSQAVLGFGVLLVGLLTAIYAADVAYDGADANSSALRTFHPVVEAVVPLLPFLLLIVAAIGVIGAGAYLKRATSGPGGALR